MAGASAQTHAAPLSTQADSQSQVEGSSSTPHSNSATASGHHTKVVEEVSSPPELTKAEELIQKKDYAAAEPLLRTVVIDDPANYVAWFDLGFAENGLNKVDDSIAAYRKSVAAKPDVFEANLNLGLQLAKSGRPDAENFLRAATQLKPTSHVAEGQKDPEPHLAAGQLLEKQNKFSDAEQEYKQALALDSSSDAIIALANLYMRGRRFPEAEGELRKLVTAHPDQAAARIQLGRVLAAEGRNDEAIAELETGAKLTPADVSLQRDLADLYSIAKKTTQAEAAYRALLVSSPNDAALHEALGKVLLEQKKFPAAQQEFLTAVKLKPELGEAYGDLAFAASENKNYPLSIKALDIRAKFLPEIAITYFLRASAYDHLRDYKQASVNYHLFLKIANGKYPDQEWQARHRLIAIEPKK